VLVAAGTHAMDRFAVKGTWTVIGGYGPSFVGRPKRELTILKAPTAAGLLLEEADSATLLHLTIEAPSAKDETQPFAHGLRVRGGTVTLDDVEVHAGDAISGKNGKAGQAGASTIDVTPPCPDVTPQFCPDPRSGDLAAKRPADVGAPGQNGSDGANGSGKLTLASDLLTTDAPTEGLSNGGLGCRGGGGASGSVSGWGYVRGGYGGVGGCPGTRGTAATSGGSSVAIVLLQGTLVVKRALLRTGFAGAGGDGGAGGAGGRGGGAGTVPISEAGRAAPLACSPANDVMGVGCATYGGVGGAGGAGGHGGGGAGGSTVGILVAHGAEASLDDATELDLGRPGSGGAGGGGGRAPAGLRIPLLK
jgi:hypothetical protein